MLRLIQARLALIARTFRLIRDSAGIGAAAKFLVDIAAGRGKRAMRHALGALQAHLQPPNADPFAAKLSAGQPSLAICVTGGVGDHIVIARFLRDLLSSAPGAEFDIYCAQTASSRWVFGAVPGFRTCFHDILFERYQSHYDIALRANQFVTVETATTNWSALHQLPDLVARIDSILRFRPKLATLIEHHPQMDNFLAAKAVFSNRCRNDWLHHMAGLGYGGHRLPLEVDDTVARAHDLSPQGYITVHNGFDANFAINGPRATKCYPHFGEVVRQVKARFPRVRIVQVGTTTSEPIDEVDVDLIGKTNLRQAAAVVGGAMLHIDNEGGLVHIAAALGVRSCVVFGPTPSNFFGYPENLNVDPPFCGGCWWITPTWMETCPRGFGVARCLTEQPAEWVAERIIAHLVTVLAEGHRTAAA